MRLYKDSDERRLNTVCHACFNNAKMAYSVNFLNELYINHYIQNEPEHCFLKTDEFDFPVGILFYTTNPLLYNNKNQILTQDISAEYLKFIIGYYKIQKRFFKHFTNRTVLFNIGVLPAFQDRGIGRQMFKAFIEELKKEQYHNAMIIIPSYLSSSIGFFERLGFDCIDSIKNVGYLYQYKF